MCIFSFSNSVFYPFLYAIVIKIKIFLSKTRFVLEESLSLSQTTNFRLFQTEKFEDNNFKFDGNGSKFSKMVENTGGKGEMAHNEQFLLFSQCFLKTCIADM